MCPLGPSAHPGPSVHPRLGCWPCAMQGEDTQILLHPSTGGCKEPGREFNLLMLCWEHRLSANLPRSIETPLRSTVAQLGSSIIHHHVRASRTPLCLHLCIAGLTWLPPAPELALTWWGSLSPHDAWCGAGSGRLRLGLFVGLRPLGLGTLGSGEMSGRGASLPALHAVFCFQRVSLAPQVGPVVMAKRHRSSVVPHNAVSRDPSVPWAGMGCRGFPSARRQCCSPQPCGCCGDSAQLSPLGACVLQPVSPWSHWGQHPWLCWTTARSLHPPVPTVAASLAAQEHRDGDQVDQRSCGRCWGTVGLRSHVLLVSHFGR